MKGFIMGVIVTAVLALVGFKYINRFDLELMRDQNNLINTQQDILKDIKLNCQYRNWISFDGDIYVCMHINKMFHQLSKPPMKQFKFPDEAEA